MKTNSRIQCFITNTGYRLYNLCFKRKYRPLNVIYRKNMEAIFLYNIGVREETNKYKK